MPAAWQAMQTRMDTQFPHTHLDGLKGSDPGGTLPPMSGSQTESTWEPRVSRLEMGFCAAFILIFAAIITSYLMLSGKIDDSTKAQNANVQVVTEVRGDIKVLDERSKNMDKKLDVIGEQLLKNK